MNDFELLALARLRDEVPLGEVSSRAEHLFRTGLEGQNAGKTAIPGASGRRAAVWGATRTARPTWWFAVAGGLTAALAAGAAGAVVLSSQPAIPASGTITVAELAYRTSAAAARQPDIRPGQWVYRQLVQSTPLLPPGSKGAPQATVRWATADDRTNAFFYHGKLVIGPWAGFLAFRGKTLRIPIPSPAVSYASLGSLPADPHALVTLFGNTYTNGTAPFRDWRAFQVIGSLLSSYVMPPRLTAELYRALGDIPGIKVDDHVLDLAGQPGIGFIVHLPGATGPAARFALEIVVNPRTYQFMGFQRLGQPNGVAVVRQALVSGPGVRP